MIGMCHDALGGVHIPPEPRGLLFDSFLGFSKQRTVYGSF